MRKRVAAGTLYAQPGERGRLVISVPQGAIAAYNQRQERDRRGSGPETASAAPAPSARPIESADAIATGNAALRQFAAIDEEWLAPVVARLGQIERENGYFAGQLQAKDELIAELQQWAARAEEARARDAQATPAARIASGQPAEQPRATWWDRCCDAIVERAERPQSWPDELLHWWLGGTDR